MTTYTEMPVKGMDVSQFNEAVDWSKPNPPFSFSGIRVGQGKQGYYSIARGIGGKGGAIMAPNRITKINVQAEYKPIHKNRITKLVVQVEYSPKPARVRIYGPAIQ